MAIITWTPASQLAPPVYLDANIVVGGLVRSHRLYPKASLLHAELLAANAPLLISDITVHESHWGLAGEAFALMYHAGGGHINWNKRIYKRHVSDIFAQHSGLVSLASLWINSLHSIGYPIDVIEATTPAWLPTIDRALTFMREFELTPADATHLALAETYAGSFVTDDHDFATLAGPNAPALDVVVLS